MSLLLPADPGTLWTRTVEPWVAGLSSYPLGNNFNFWIFPMNYEVKEFLQKNFLLQVGFELVKPGLLGRRPIHYTTKFCWENNFGTSWYSMRSRNLNRKCYKFKSLPDVERRRPSKNNYKFFGGNFLLHLHPATRTLYLVARILPDELWGQEYV